MNRVFWFGKAWSYFKANFNRFFVVSLGLFLILLSSLINPPEGLSPEGLKTLAVFAVAVLWWVSAVVPLVVTSIFVLISFPLLGLADSWEVYSYFGNTAVFFLLGAFILSSAFFRSGLARWVSSRLFAKERTEVGLNLKIYLMALILSFFMAGNAVAVMLFPIVGELIKDFGLEGTRNEQLPYFSMAWGVITGSNLTLLGGARGPLAIAILENLTGQHIGFAQWSAMSLPLVLLMGGMVFTLIWVISRKDFKILPKMRRGTSCLTPRQLLVAVVFIATVLMWFFMGDKLGIANISLATVFILFALNLITWKEVEEDVNWGVILMYGGAIVLAKMLQKTGVVIWMLRFLSVSHVLSGHLSLFVLIISAFTIVLTELMSNSAVVVLVLQIVIPLSLKIGFNPVLATFVVGVSSGFAYAFPMGSPVLALVHSRLISSPWRYILLGLLLDILFLLSVFLVCKVLWVRIFF